MVAACFTACGTIVEPSGTYTDSSGTNVIEVGAYDSSAETGNMTVSNTLNDNAYEGTYVLSQNEAGVSSILTFTSADGETMEFVYDSTLDAMQDLSSGITYYGPNAAE